MTDQPHSPSDFEILGLPEDAPKDVVERKYGALLRAYKQRTDEYGVTENDILYYQKITAAYDRIVGTVHDFSDPNPTSVIPFKIRRFFYKMSANLEHYKFAIAAVVAVGVLVVIVVTQLLSIETRDLNIKFVGAFSTFEQNQLIYEINEKSEVVEDSEITFFTVTSQTTMDSDAQDAAKHFRAQFTAGSIDLILIDKANYDAYIREPVFLDLTDYLKDHQDDPAFANLTLLTHKKAGEDDPVPDGIYGIEFTERGGAYFEEMQLDWLNDYLKEDRSMILTVCRTGKNTDKALDYITELLQSTSVA